MSGAPVRAGAPRGRCARHAPRLARGLLVLSALAAGAGSCAAPAPRPATSRADWLVDPSPYVARVVRDADSITLENGLARRRWRLEPGCATVALDQLVTGTSLLRGPRPEARLVLDGVALDVGGLVGQPDQAFLLPGWERALAAPEHAFRLADVREEPVDKPFDWAHVFPGPDRPWPPPGRRLVFLWRLAPADALALCDGDADRAAALAAIEVEVHHELYDGLPAFGRWLVLRNRGARAVRVDRLVGEVLAAVEADSQVDSAGTWRLPPIVVRSDYAFAGMGRAALEQVVEWKPDPLYATQVNYERRTPCLLECSPPLGPGVDIDPGGELTGFRLFELLPDSTERERAGLAERRLWRTVAPWTLENPLMMHLRLSDDASVLAAIDQCADVGFEALILSFGSGFDLEDDRPEALARWKRLADAAHARGLKIGGYSLPASRSIGPDTDVIDRSTGQPGHARFGHSPCLGSDWGRAYLAKVRAFLEATGFDLLEHDGSYPGDTCASTTHRGHRGWDDSQWTQWTAIRDLYRWCRGRGVFLNVPDSYFLCGSNKTGMGYRETNWSLPRDRQPLHARQNIFDGTWDKTPSMGWMFVPLTEYQGGGEAATLEPLAEHLDAYGQHLSATLGAGVQACWRGPRLYDTPATRDLVAGWVAWYKAHREVLESDVLHLRRADGRDVDALLHVNPGGREAALLVAWNPLPEDALRTLRVPLRLAGLARRAIARGEDGAAREVPLDGDGVAEVELAVPAGRQAWVAFERAGPGPGAPSPGTRPSSRGPGEPRLGAGAAAGGPPGAP